MMEEVRVRVPPGRLLIRDARCPKGCSLLNPEKKMSGQLAISAQIHLRGQTGLIHFNPFYGVYEVDSDVLLHEGDIVEVHCPHCDVSLAGEEQCGMCNVPMFTLHLADGGEIRACPKVGCRNHSLTIVDLDAQFAEYYNDELRPKM